MSIKLSQASKDDLGLLMKTLKETTDLTVRELAEMFGKGSTTVQYHLNKTKADQPVKTSKNRKPVKNHAQS